MHLKKVLMIFRGLILGVVWIQHEHLLLHFGIMLGKIIG